MKADFVLIAQRRGNSALRILRVGFSDLAFGETKNTSIGGKLHRSTQAGDAGAHNDEVGFSRQRCHEESSQSGRFCANGSTQEIGLFAKDCLAFSNWENW